MSRVSVKKFIAPLMLFFALAVFSSWGMLASPGLITNHDWAIAPFANQMRNNFIYIHYLWRSSFGGWDVTPINFGLGEWFIVGFPSFLGIDGEILTKAMVIFCISLSGFFFYYTCTSFKKSYKASILAAIFYMFSPWIFNRVIAGDTYLGLMGYPLLPLSFLFFVKDTQAYERKVKIKYLSLSSISLFFVSIVGAVIFVASLVLYSIVSIACSTERRKTLYIHIRSLVVLCFLVLLLYSYWAIPFFLSERNTGIPQSAVEPEFRSKNAQLLNITRLCGQVIPFYSDSVRAFPWWTIISFLVVSLIWIAPIIRPKRKKVMFFSLLATLSFFLGKGINPPLGQIYEWAYFNVPFFQAFRDPYKWVMLACFAYSFLLCETIEGFSKILHRFFVNIKFGPTAPKLSRENLRKLLSILLTFVVCSVIFINAYPFFSGDFGKNLKQSDFPPEYSKVNEWLENQHDDFRVSWLPLDPRIQYDWAPHGQSYLMAGYSIKPHFGPRPGGSPDEVGRFSNFVAMTLYDNRTKFLGKLLGLANVKYVIYPDDAESYDWHHLLGLSKFSKKQLKSNLQHQSDLEPFKKEGSMIIYRNTQNIPHLYATNQVTLVGGGYSSLISLSYLDNFNFRDSTILFANQLSHHEALRALKHVDTILIQDNDFYDIAFSFLPEDYNVDIAKHVYLNYDPVKDWIALHYYWGLYDWSYLDPTNECAFTRGKATLTIPFQTNSLDKYDIWVKLFVGPNGGSMDVAIDNNALLKLNTISVNEGCFLWRSLGRFELISGEHTIVFNNSEGKQAIANVVIAPQKSISEATDMVLQSLRDKNLVLIYEVDRVCTKLALARVSREQGSDVSLGSALTLNGKAEATFSVFVPKSDKYEIYLRAMGSCPLTFMVGTEKRRVNLSNTGFNWYRIGEMYLTQGNHNISISLSEKGAAHLDELLIKSMEFTKVGLSETINFSYQKISPTEYKIRVRTEKPFFLVLSEAYDEYWRAYVNEEEVRPLIGYSFVNVFPIHEVGDLEISLCFEKQKYSNYGLFVSLSTFIFAIVYVIAEKLRDKGKRGTSQADPGS